MQTSITIVYQDELLMVIDKPAGLVVDPSETQKTGTLAEILQIEFGIKLERGGIVHRLDKDTSGLLLVAKTQQALENLQSQFKQRGVKKEYIALVHGLMGKDITVKGAIMRNPKNREKFVVDEQGKEAETLCRPIENFQFSSVSWRTIFNDLNKNQMIRLDRSGYGKFTLLRCFPLTGRTHQIRVHLKYIGHPIVSDNKYGGRKTFRLDHRWCPRQFLHAAKIEFKHPATGEMVSLESMLPEDLKLSLEKLVKLKHGTQ